MRDISRSLKYIKRRGYYPELPVVNSAPEPKVIVNGKKVLMFASNNYFNLLHDPRVIDASIEGTKKWGIGSGSSRLFSGNLEIHEHLEKAIADFKNREAGLTFVSGWMANEGCIPALINVLEPKSMLMGLKDKKYSQDSIIFSDEFNHGSIITGCQLSKAEKVIFKHNDISDLKDKISRYPIKQRKMIIIEGIYSMDGDIGRLDQVLEVAKFYRALVYLDDAHATGILGKTGRGTEEYFSCDGQVDIIMGTFTKVFGGVGGFIVGSQDLIDYLRITSRTFIFSAPIPPPVVCGLLKSIEIVDRDAATRNRIKDNARFLRETLVENNFDICGSQSHIVPVLIGEEAKAIKFSKLLLDRGLFVPTARFPAVPKGMARLRFTISSAHTIDQISFLVDSLVEVRNQLPL